MLRGVELIGLGRGFGRGFGRGMGPISYCICLRCGYRVPKQPGVRCLEMRCPKCGAAMVREGSYHHRLYLERLKKNKQ